MFLVNSRLGHFSAPGFIQVPFSRSYGVNLPSSLAVIHSSTLGSSPHPPVSVYGTGCCTLNAHQIFLRACLPALSDCPKTLGTVGFQLLYALQRAIPSARSSVTSRSLACLHSRRRNLNRLVIRSPLRVSLSPRLTLSRLTLLRNPWVFGVYVSTYIVVTYAYIFFSSRSSIPHRTPSRLTGMLPYRCVRIHTSHSFGDGLDARSSSTQLRSTSELLRTL